MNKSHIVKWFPHDRSNGDRMRMLLLTQPEKGADEGPIYYFGDPHHLHPRNGEKVTVATFTTPEAARAVWEMLAVTDRCPAIDDGEFALCTTEALFPEDQG